MTDEEIKNNLLDAKEWCIEGIEECKKRIAHYKGILTALDLLIKPLEDKENDSKGTD